MIYLLDTNAAIALLKEHPQMLNHVHRVGRSTLRVCAPVEAELWFGVAKSARKEQNRARLLTLLEWRPVYLLRVKQRSTLVTSTPILRAKAHPLDLMICRLPPSLLLTT